MLIRDRIKELRRVEAGRLRPNPHNWRTHPQHQREALQGILAEVGYAAALLARELPDGTLRLIDGHLRAEITPDQEVPVLVLDVNEAEEKKLLAVLDPLAVLAETDEKLLKELVAEIETESAALQQLLNGLTTDDEEEAVEADADRQSVPQLFQLVVDCESEAEQQAVYERLKAEGYSCRLIVL
jgi:ParB-like chromosome segregation protein Spo0J